MSASAGVRLDFAGLDREAARVLAGDEGGAVPATRRKGAEAPVYSDDRLALTLIDRYGIDLRYVDAWKQWLLWDGTRWRADTTLAIFDMARRLCRAVLEC